MFGCASHREIFQLHQKLPSWQPKKPDRYWCAPVRTPGRTESPVISGKEVGYVRRSELKRPISGKLHIGLWRMRTCDLNHAAGPWKDREPEAVQSRNRGHQVQAEAQA
jgi:hypothetical protein